VLTLAGFVVFGKNLKSDAVAWLWENPPFVGNAAALVVHSNIPLIINIALDATVTEFSAVVSYWGK